MGEYFATLHKRSDRHKKQFALLVSGGFTGLMFVMWFATNFGQGATVAQNVLPSETQVHTLVAEGQVPEVSPLQAVTASVVTSWQALTASFSNLLNFNTTTYGPR